MICWMDLAKVASCRIWVRDGYVFAGVGESRVVIEFLNKLLSELLQLLTDGVLVVSEHAVDLHYFVALQVGLAFFG